MSVIKLVDNWERVSVGEHVLKLQDTANGPLFIGNPAPISGEDFVEWLKGQPSTNGIYWKGDGYYNDAPFPVYNCVFWIINPSVEVMRVKWIDNNGNVVLSKTKVNGLKNTQYSLPLVYEEGFGIELESEADVGMVGSDEPLDLLDYFSLNPKAYVQPWHSTIVTGALHTTLPIFANINDPADIVTGFIRVPLATEGSTLSLLVGSTRPLKTQPAKQKYILTLTADVSLKEEYENTDIIDCEEDQLSKTVSYTLNGNPLLFPFQHWSVVAENPIVQHKDYNRSIQLEIMSYVDTIMQECGKMFSTKVSFFTQTIDYYRLAAIEVMDESVVDVQ